MMHDTSIGPFVLSLSKDERVKSEILNILGSSRNDHGVVVLLQSANDIRFFNLFRAVVQDDKNLAVIAGNRLAAFPKPTIE